jgi:cytochrome c oxidase cbb3-type subunit 3
MSFGKRLGPAAVLLTGTMVMAMQARADGPPAPSSMENPVVVIMVILVVILALSIVLLANVVLGAAEYRSLKDRGLPKEGGTPEDGVLPEKEAMPEDQRVPEDWKVEGEGGMTKQPAARARNGGAMVMLASIPGISGLSDAGFYILTGVIFFELIVVLTLVYNLKKLIGRRKEEEKALSEVSVSPTKTVMARIREWNLWNKLNSFRPVEQEADLDLGHDYDGIRELDNRLPPWWLYGFYCTIIFACVYLWRYHVSHSAPLSGEEFAISVKRAEASKAEFLKKAANNVDENSVKLMVSAADLGAGKIVFESTCFACHGKHGEGGVGPNLTDEYWLHGGDIKDIFRTIKYGWPDKGMKSWKDDYSPLQIAQIASYVKSLGGTKPENPKAPQGSLYKP